MSIFNSLGSNYNLQYVFRSLFSDSSGQNLKLKNYLAEKYKGKTILTYKGREALILALKILNLPKESLIAINGFTCFAVYKAINEAGFTSVCLDLNEKNSDLNYFAQVLEKELVENKKIKYYLYPLFTYKIRFLYDLFLGKIFHYALKGLNLLSKPMQEGLYDFYSLPNWYCNLALNEFKNLSKQLRHRREIVKIYAKNLNKKVLQSRITSKINLSANLRFPIFLENREELIKFLKQSKIFVSDIWYSDVSPECPNAVEISHKILNLPTHINVTKKDALKISEKINEWLRTKR